MKPGWDGVEPPSPTEEASPPARQMEGGLQADAAAAEAQQVKQLPGQKRRDQSLGDSRLRALERNPSVAQLHRRQIVAHALEAPSWFEQESRANAESSV